MPTSPTRSVLFVCTHNAARSQMAEGLLRARYGDRYVAASAGTEPGRVHPLTIEVMNEIGIDISKHVSKSVSDLKEGRLYDVVVTVCDAARESCPYVPAKEKVLHHGFQDPSAAAGPRNARLHEFRKVRDEIAAWIDDSFGRD